MTEAAMIAARAQLPPPEKAIVSACNEVASNTLSDMTLGVQTKVGIGRNKLEPFLLARHEGAREALVATLVDAVVASHKPRLVAAMHDVGGSGS
jgi:hypothetical protein